jgi:putative ABC transport system permease protein
MLGIPLEWYVVRVVLFEESGFLFEVLMPWKQAIGISAGAMIVATLAGLLPAMRAVKTRIPDAIAYE